MDLRFQCCCRILQISNHLEGVRQGLSKLLDSALEPEQLAFGHASLSVLAVRVRQVRHEVDGPLNVTREFGLDPSYLLDGDISDVFNIESGTNGGK